MAVDWIARAMAANGGGGGEAGRGISQVSVNASGDLIIYYDDGTNENAGHVVGADGTNGQVYVPSIVIDDDGNKYLHWTLQDEPGAVPDDTYIGEQDAVWNSDDLSDFDWEGM